MPKALSQIRSYVIVDDVIAALLAMQGKLNIFGMAAMSIPVFSYLLLKYNI